MQTVSESSIADWRSSVDTCVVESHRWHSFLARDLGKACVISCSSPDGRHDSKPDLCCFLVSSTFGELVDWEKIDQSLSSLRFAFGDRASSSSVLFTGLPLASSSARLLTLPRRCVSSSAVAQIDDFKSDFVMLLGLLYLGVNW